MIEALLSAGSTVCDRGASQQQLAEQLREELIVPATCAALTTMGSDWRLEHKVRGSPRELWRPDRSLRIQARSTASTCRSYHQPRASKEL